jgi:hypothetical protein
VKPPPAPEPQPVRANPSNERRHEASNVSEIF